MKNECKELSDSNGYHLYATRVICWSGASDFADEDTREDVEWIQARYLDHRKTADTCHEASNMAKAEWLEWYLAETEFEKDADAMTRMASTLIITGVLGLIVIAWAFHSL